MKKEYTIEELRDLIATAVYIQTECQDRYHNQFVKGIFLSEVDTSMDIALAFIEKYPVDYEWENRKYSWEERLYQFFLKAKKQ